MHAPIGSDRAAFYNVEPLKVTYIFRQEQIPSATIFRQLAAQLPGERRCNPKIRDMEAYGCNTTMRLVSLLVRLGEDQTKDIDFTRTSIRACWQTGRADALRVLREWPWEREIDWNMRKRLIFSDNCAVDSADRCADDPIRLNAGFALPLIPAWYAPSAPLPCRPLQFRLQP
jgi:hypothetical protein